MFLAWISLAVSVVGNLPYIAKALRGKIRPEIATWGIWSLITLLALASYRAEGAEASAMFILGDLIMTGSIFLVALFKGKGGISRLDAYCILLSLIGLAVWQISSNPMYQILGAITADLVALIPTIKKTLDDPGSESATAFIASTVAALLGIMSITQWRLGIILYPLYLYSINLITAAVIISAQYVKRKKEA